MSTGTKVGIGIGAFFIFIIISLITLYFTYANKAVGLENAIEYRVENNKQVLGNGQLKVKEIASVTNLQAAQVADVWQKVMDGRYKGGAGQMMLWIKEQNPSLGPEVYTNIQREITAYRDQFTAEQKQTLDVCRSYEDLRERPWSKLWVRLAGFPSSDYESKGGKKLCRAVTSAGAVKAFETGIDEGLNLAPQQ